MGSTGLALELPYSFIQSLVRLESDVEEQCILNLKQGSLMSLVVKRRQDTIYLRLNDAVSGLEKKGNGDAEFGIASYSFVKKNKNENDGTRSARAQAAISKSPKQDIQFVGNLPVGSQTSFADTSGPFSVVNKAQNHSQHLNTPPATRDKVTKSQCKRSNKSESFSQSTKSKRNLLARSGLKNSQTIALQNSAKPIKSRGKTSVGKNSSSLPSKPQQTIVLQKDGSKKVINIYTVKKLDPHTNARNLISKNIDKLFPLKRKSAFSSDNEENEPERQNLFEPKGHDELKSQDPTKCLDKTATVRLKRIPDDVLANYCTKKSVSKEPSGELTFELDKDYDGTEYMGTEGSLKPICKKECVEKENDIYVGALQDHDYYPNSQNCWEDPNTSINDTLHDTADLNQIILEGKSSATSVSYTQEIKDETKTVVFKIENQPIVKENIDKLPTDSSVNNDFNATNDKECQSISDAHFDFDVPKSSYLELESPTRSVVTKPPQTSMAEDDACAISSDENMMPPENIIVLDVLESPHVHQSKDICDNEIEENDTQHAQRDELKPSKKQNLKHDRSQCDVCGISLSNKYQLEIHKRTLHEGRYRFRCDRCDYGSEKRIDLDLHKAKCYAVSNREIPATTGSNTKINSEKRKATKKPTGHGGCNYRFMCSACGFETGERSLFMSHKCEKAGNKIHKGKQNCSTCGKSFPSLSALKLHQIKHTGEKNFKCDKCGLALSKKRALQDHVRVVHHGQYSFTCSCGYGTERRSSFKAHKCGRLRKKYPRNGKHEVTENDTENEENVSGRERTSVTGESNIHGNAAPKNNTSLCESTNYKMAQTKAVILKECERDAKECDNQSVSELHVADECSAEENNSGLEVSMIEKKEELSHLSQIHNTEDANEFKCHLCGITLSSSKILVTHIRTVHERVYRFMCSKCGFGTEKRPRFMEHNCDKMLNRTNGVKPFCCSICSKGFSSNAQLEVHEATHTGEKNFTCEICGLSLGKKRSLEDHVRVVHHGKYRFTCACGYATDKRVNFAQHTCGQKIRKKGEKQEVVCPWCQKVFSCHSAYKAHEVTHTDERNHICDQCGFAFRTKGSLNTHVKYIHNDNFKYKCAKCGQGLHKRIQLTTHTCGMTKRQVRVVDLDKLLIPTKNAQEMNDLQAIAEHVLEEKNEQPERILVKTPDGRYGCILCYESFNHTDTLAKHEKLQHPELAARSQMDKPAHSCPICKQIFITLGRYKRHMVIHSGERNFVCDECGDTFLTAQTMKNHIRIVHREEYKFKCDKCGQGFRYVRAFRKHVCGRQRKTSKGGSLLRYKRKRTRKISNVTEGLLSGQKNISRLRYKRSKMQYHTNNSTSSPSSNSPKVAYHEQMEYSSNQITTEEEIVLEEVSLVSEEKGMFSKVMYENLGYVENQAEDKRNVSNSDLSLHGQQIRVEDDDRIIINNVNVDEHGGYFYVDETGRNVSIELS